MQQVVFHLLGPPDVFCRGSLDRSIPIKIPRRRSRALLYYMVSTHTPQPRERLLNLLCGEMDEEGARHAFKTMLAEVRAHLRTIDASIDWIISDGDHLTFNPRAPIWLDTEVFEKDAVVQSRHVSQALTLYRGDFLDGFFLKDAPDFETWVQSTRDHFRHLYLSALRHLAEMDEANHQLDEAISCMQLFLAADPFSEEAHTYLMQLFWQAGDRTGALRQYEKLSTLLMEEFSVQPSAWTQALYQRIAQPYGASDAHWSDTSERAAFAARVQSERSKRDGTFAVGASAVRWVQGAGMSLLQPAAPTESRATVGREKEMTWIQRHLMGTENPFLLICGEMGCGKTHVLRQVVQRLEGGWIDRYPCWSIAQANCRQAEGKNRYHAIAEMLRSTSLRERIPSVVLPEVWRAQLINLVPDLFVGDHAALVVLEPTVLADALVAVLGALASAQSPLLLIIDNMHWADEETLAVLAHCVHALRTTSLFLLGTFVPGMADERIELLRQENEWAMLEMPPLIAADIEMITRSVLCDLAPPPAPTDRANFYSGWVSEGDGESSMWDEDDVVFVGEWCYRQCEGNPFLALAWLSQDMVNHVLTLRIDRRVANNGPGAADHGVPDAIKCMVDTQLRLLSRDAVAFVSVAAYLGVSFQLTTATRLLQFDVHTALTVVDELLKRRIIRENVDSGWYVFVHQVVRTVVLAEMTGGQLALVSGSA